MNKNLKDDFFAGELPTHELFKIVRNKATERSLSDSLEAGMLATFYIVLSLLHRLPDPYWLLSLCAIFAIVPVNKLAIKINQTNSGGFLSNSRFVRWNWLALLVGGPMMVLTVIDSLMGGTLLV